MINILSRRTLSLATVSIPKKSNQLNTVNVVPTMKLN